MTMSLAVATKTVVVYSLSFVWLFWDPMNCSQSGSSVHGILQARILEWVAISFSKGSSQPRDQTCISCSAEFFTTDPPGKPYAKDTNIQSKKWRLAHLDFQKSFCPHVDTLSIAFRTLYVWAVLLFFFSLPRMHASTAVYSSLSNVLYRSFT